MPGVILSLQTARAAPSNLQLAASCLPACIEAATRPVLNTACIYPGDNNNRRACFSSVYVIPIFPSMFNYSSCLLKDVFRRLFCMLVVTSVSSNMFPEQSFSLGVYMPEDMHIP